MRQDRLGQLAREAASLAEVATQLGTAPPAVVRELLPLLTAAGLLVADGHPIPRYRPGRPRPAVDVVRLPPARERQLRDQDDRARYTSFATDLLSIAGITAVGGRTVAVLGEAGIHAVRDHRDAVAHVREPRGELFGGRRRNDDDSRGALDRFLDFRKKTHC